MFDPKEYGAQWSEDEHKSLVHLGVGYLDLMEAVKGVVNLDLDRDLTSSILVQLSSASHGLHSVLSQFLNAWNRVRHDEWHLEPGSVRDEIVQDAFHEIDNVIIQLDKAVDLLGGEPIAGLQRVYDNLSKVDRSLSYREWRNVSYPNLIGPHADRDTLIFGWARFGRYVIAHPLWDQARLYASEVTPNMGVESRKALDKQMKDWAGMCRLGINAWCLDGSIVITARQGARLPNRQLDNADVVDGDFAGGPLNRGKAFFVVILASQYAAGQDTASKHDQDGPDGENRFLLPRTNHVGRANFDGVNSVLGNLQMQFTKQVCRRLMADNIDETMVIEWDDLNPDSPVEVPWAAAQMVEGSNKIRNNDPWGFFARMIADIGDGWGSTFFAEYSAFPRFIPAPPGGGGNPPPPVEAVLELTESTEQRIVVVAKIKER